MASWTRSDVMFGRVSRYGCDRATLASRGWRGRASWGKAAPGALRARTALGLPRATPGTSRSSPTTVSFGWLGVGQSSRTIVSRLGEGGQHECSVQGHDQRRYPRFGAGLGAIRCAQGTRRRPNVVYIVLDDVGFSAMSVLRRPDRNAEHRPDRQPTGCATPSGIRPLYARRHVRAC